MIRDEARPRRGGAPAEPGARVLPFRRPEHRPAASAEAPPWRSQEAEDLRRGEAAPLRRHRGERIRHSRPSLLRRFVRPFLLAFCIVGLPASVTAWVFASPVFALTELDVESTGGGRVSEDWILHTLEPARGWNLPRLPLPWIDEALKKNSWVRSTSLRKELPNRLSVRVVERREVALLRQAGARDLWYVDADGEAIVPFDPSAGAIDLPLVTAADGTGLRGALGLLAEIEDAASHGTISEWAGDLSEIEVLGKNDFRVFSAALPFPLLLRPGSLAHKASYLEGLLPEIHRRYGSVDAVDLRFSNKIILQPAGSGSKRGSAGVQQRGLGS